ncbi:MAG: DNA polymerase IV [Candidatus Pacebacteria bacterium]|nr:DNA polymerase IV [Candidatus Paceibacterota bacterium]
MAGHRIIGHLDMDAFFASLEEKVSPHFKGKPIVVGCDPKDGKGRGVVSTANYAAREYGIGSALPISKAWKLSELAISQGKEGVIFLPSNFPLYERVSKEILGIIRKYSDTVEQGSIDEFYFDLSSCDSYEEVEAVSKRLKKEILEREGVTCSVGVGPNKMVAKIAAGVNKPNGFFIVEDSAVEDFLRPLPIRKLPGIGAKTAGVLQSEGVYIIEDLLRFSLADMKNMFKKAGEDIYYRIRGIDDSPLVTERELKSIGEQITFEYDTSDSDYVISMFLDLCGNLFDRLAKEGFKSFSKIVVTVRFDDFKTASSSRSIDEKVNKTKSKLKIEALKIFLPYLDRRKNHSLRPIRLIGLRFEKLS